MKKNYVLFFLLILNCLSNLYGQAPVVNSFFPEKGEVSSIVTVNGKNFNQNAVNNIVYYGNTKASVINATATQLTIKMPPVSGNDEFTVLNISNGLSGKSLNKFITTYSRKDKMYASDFEVETILPSGASYAYLTIGDLDGDHKKDLVLINNESATIQIFKNTKNDGTLASGSFAKALVLPLKSAASRVEIADMNGDGKLDIIVAQFDQFSIFINNIAGDVIDANSFTKVDLNIRYGSPRFAIADMDGDGKPDIVIPGTIYKNKCVQAQILTTSFDEKVSYPSGHDVNEILISDLDNDGKLDIIESGNSYILSIYHNQAIDQILDVSSFVKSTIDLGSANSVAIADFDRDGKKDIVVALKQTNYLRIYQNNYTSGTLTTASFILKNQYYSGTGPVSVKAADFDGDGAIDLAVVNSDGNSLSIFKNTYNPTNVLSSWVEKITCFDFGNKPNLLFADDLNGDGTLDVLALNVNDKTLVIRKNRESGIPKIESFFPLSAPSNSEVKINGKNFGNVKTDIRVMFDDRFAKVLEVSDTQIKVLSPAGANYATISVYNAYVNRTAWSSRKFKTTFLTKEAISKSDFKQVAFFDAPVNELFTKSFLKDFDGDGLLDLAYINRSGEIIVRRNNGEKGKEIDCSIYANQTKIIAGAYQSVSFADLDNDGFLDVIARESETGISYYFKNSSKIGEFKFEGPIPINGYYGLQITDIDGDGRLDFGEYRNVTTENSIKPTFKKSFNYAKMLIDFNGDGKMDKGISDNGILSMYLNLSSPGSISDSSFVYVGKVNGVNSYSLERDLDNDGKMDLISNGDFYKNTSTSTILSYTKIGPLINKKLDIYDPYYYSEIFTFADVNGDGLDDGFRMKNSFFNKDQDTLMICQNMAASDLLPKYPTGVKYSHNEDFRDSHIIHAANILGTEDLNNDDRPEIILWDGYEEHFIILENLCSNIAVNGPPKVSSFSPAAGNVKSLVTINGSNFNPDFNQNAVYFGTVKAKVIKGSTTQLQVEVPPRAVYSAINILDLETKLNVITEEMFTVKLGNGKGEDFTANSFKLKENAILHAYSLPMLVADLDGDQIPEIVVGGEVTANKRVFTYKSTGVDSQGNPNDFVNSTSNPTNYRFGLPVHYMQAADLDGDGKLDIVTVNSDGMEVYENLSTPSCKLLFRGDIAYDSGLMRPFCLADINNDGKIDILFCDPFQTIYVYLNDSKQGSISFEPYIKLNVKIKEGNLNYATIKVKDMDGDGLNDLLVGSVQASGNRFLLSIYRNLQPTGPNSLSFDIPKNIEVPYFKGFLLTDFDSDGKPEVLLVRDEDFELIKNTSTPGLLSLSDGIVFKHTTGVSYFNFGDFDGDGKPDLIGTGETKSTSGSVVAIFKNKIVPGVFNDDSFGTPVSYAFPGNSRTSEVVDFNNDGRADILFSDHNTGRVSLLQNNIYNSGLEIKSSAGFTEYTSKLDPVVIDPGISLKYTGATTLTSVSVFVVDGFNPEEDVLAFVNNPNTIGNIIGSFDKNSCTLTLTSTNNTATIDQWEKAIQSVSYFNSQNNERIRTIGFLAKTGSITSLEANKIINVKRLLPPVINSITPMVGTMSTLITITGTNFESTSKVSFGGLDASSFKLVSSTALTAVIGPGASGDVLVTTKGGSSTLNGFTYVPIPIITANGKTTFLQGEHVLLNASPATGYTYTWTKDGNIISEATSAQYVAVASGVYKANINYGTLTTCSNEIAVSAIYSLPTDNFKLATTAVACKGSKTGAIQITALQNLNYTATIVNGGITTTHDFNRLLDLNGLEAGNYSICITVANQPSYKRCFELSVTEPKDLSLFATANVNEPKVLIKLSGAKNYFIELNGNTYQTADSEIILPLIEGSNVVKLRSDLACQGAVEKTISFTSKITFFPNPVEGKLTVNMGADNSTYVTIELYDLSGNRIYQAKQLNRGYLDVDMGKLHTGFYIVKITTNKGGATSKIFKK